MFDAITTTLCLVLAAVLCAYLNVRHRYGYWKRSGIPYAQPIRFPYGNIKGALTSEHLSDIMTRYYHQFKGCGPFVGTFFLLSRTVLAVDIGFVKNVLIRDFAQFANRGVYYNENDDPLSAHLFSLEPTPWRNLRSKLTPTFTSGKMKFMFRTIVDVAAHFRQVMDERVAEIGAAGGPLEVRDLLSRFTTDVIGSTAFGIECKSLADPESKFLRMGRKALRDQRHHPLIIFMISAYPPIGRWLGLKVVPDDVNEFFGNIVRQTVAYRRQNAIDGNGDGVGVKRNDFMDLLINLRSSGDVDDADTVSGSGDLLTMNEIAAQAFVFFLAGFETSSTTMTFALYELAANVEVQTRLRHEIDSVLERHNGELTYEVMMEMSYLDQVINETLRKYPPLPLLTRQTTSDYHVPEYDFTIPAGFQVWIPARAIHMDPEFYADPELFDPDRFGPEEVLQRNPLTFLPFGDGPRNCIGLRFGMMQVRIGLVTLLRQFQFGINAARTTHPAELSPTDFILTPKDGVMWLDVKRLVGK